MVQCPSTLNPFQKEKKLTAKTAKSKGGSPQPVEKPAIEQYPEFTQKILELLGKLPADAFVELIINDLEAFDFPGDFEKSVIEAMKYLETPAPERVVEFLFDGVENRNLADESYTAAIDTLSSLTGKEDINRLIRAIAGNLLYYRENKNFKKILELLEELTEDLD